MEIRDWIYRQWAQQLVNFHLIDFRATAESGQRVETSEADFPFHIVKDVYLAGQPAIVLQSLRRPFGLFEDCFPPRDRRGMIKRFLRSPLPLERVETLDEALCLSTYWLPNYWHWLYEGLPKLLLAEEAGFRGVYLVPPGRFIAETLDLLGLPAERIRIHDRQIWKVARLHMAPRFDGEQMIRRPALLDRLRRRLMEAALQRAHPRKDGVSRLYLSRNRPNMSRGLVNEPEVRALVTGLGFHDYVAETFSVAQQIADHSVCEAIVGPHGAGFTNSLFLPPGALVVELFSPLYIWPVSLPATRLLGHRYYPLLPRLQDPGIPYPHGLEVLANLDLLETTLQRELASARRQ